jgi:hypothetical protein
MTLERRYDRLDPAQLDKDVVAILALVVEVRGAWEQAVDGGTWAPRSGEIGPGSSILQNRPTEAAVASPTRSQLRAAAREASSAIAEARQALEDAGYVLSRAFRLSDPAEYEEFLERRAAATQNGGGRRTTGM